MPKALPRSRGRSRSKSRSEMASRLQAIDKVQAIIEFAMDGTILHANENFLRAMGYTLDEVVGRPHGMFVEPEYARSEGRSRHIRS